VSARLEDLVKGLAHELLGDPGAEVAELEYDSRQIQPGSLFVAIPGGEADGHRYCSQALDRGASALVVERVDDALRARLEADPRAFGVARVHDSRAALAELAARFLGRPGDDLCLIGVTGTNGKTSTVRMLYAILERAGTSVGSLGTIATRFDGHEERSQLTTPESLDLQRTLARMRDGGVETAVVEVSSHALVQGRVRTLRFDAAVFTHLTQDHLDFHGDMQEYARAKALLFGEPYLAGTAVLNVHDPLCGALAERARAAGHDVLTFGRGRDSGAHVRSVDESVSLAGSLVRIEGLAQTLDLSLPLPGDFQVENALAAIATAHVLGIEPAAISEGLRSCPPVPGRLERVGSGDPVVLVDYAHTPDALERVLGRVRPLVPGRLLAVFGCGGDRDSSKRAPMAEAACRHADHVVATSDNPRTEDPVAILRDVGAGLSGSFEVIVDRRQAIRTAIGLARPGDVVVIAGKGHEDYQILGRERLPFDDRIEALEALRALGIPT
jgi:UDP-N-acetylmuramoyl-L-alanyl-D-glutamate--2,6-diaminopimelate ligase